MKKILSVLFGIVLSVPLFASTCQTRVDQKWDKSTQERIISCLSPQAEVAATQPEVIIHGVYSVHPAQQKPKQASTQTVKQYVAQTVYNEYIDDDHYPLFKNDFLPQFSDEAAHETALQALQNEREAAQAASLPILKNTHTVNKPNRTVTHTVTETHSTTVTVQAPQDSAAPSPAQIQQAQALQNDPLAPAGADSYTDQFLDDGILGPADFGYNSTDPAFAQ